MLNPEKTILAVKAWVRSIPPELEECLNAMSDLDCIVWEMGPRDNVQKMTCICVPSDLGSPITQALQAIVDQVCREKQQAPRR